MSDNGNMKDLLKEQVEEADLALAIKKVDDNPEQWALASSKYANALSELANQEDDEAAFVNYQDASRAFQNALNILTSNEYFPDRINTTLQYVRTLRNYGLRKGGDSGLMHLHHGLRLTDGLISDLTDPFFSFDNAMLHIEKGHFYRVLAGSDRQENRKDHLENAARALWGALNVLRAKEKFQEWAMALIGLGLSLYDLSRLQDNDEAKKSLLTAIDAFKSAAAYYQPDINTLDHAFAQMEMGRCLLILARRQTNEDALESTKLAVRAFKEALKYGTTLFENELVLRTRADLAQSLSLLANLNLAEAKDILTEVVALHRENIIQLEKNNDPSIIAVAQGFLGRDLANLALHYQDEECLQIRTQIHTEAIEALRLSISDELKKTRPKDWNLNLIELATTLHSYANELEDEERIKQFEEIITLYETLRLSITKENDPILWARIQQWQALAFAHTGEADATPRGLQRMKLAELGFRQALTVFTKEDKPDDYIQIQKNLGHLLYVISQRSDCNNPLSFLNSAALIMETLCGISNDEEAYKVDIPALFHLAIILWKRAMIKEEDYSEDFIKANKLFLFINHQYNDEDSNAIETQSNYAEFLLNWGERDLSKAGLLHLKHARSLWKNIENIAQKENHKALYQIASENLDITNMAINNHRKQQPFYKRLFWH